MSSYQTSSPTNGTSPQPQKAHIFHAPGFSFESTAHTTLSQPYQQGVAVPRTSSVGLRPRTAPNYGSSSPSTVSAGATPGSNLSFDAFSPSDNMHFLETRSPASPSSYDMSGFSAGTTPGFDTLGEIDFPGLSGDEGHGEDQRMYDGAVPSVNVEGISSARNSATSSGYPISPRLTVSPHPDNFTPSSSSLGKPSMHNSPNIKIEHSSPESMNRIRPCSPRHQQSSSSSSSGLNPQDSLTITRDGNGNWRGGLEPSARGDEQVLLSLNEQEFERRKREKNAEVEEWLRRSSEQLPRQPMKENPGGLSAPSLQRGRARSIGDFRSNQSVNKPVLTGESSAGRSGAPVDDDDTYHYDDDNSSVSPSWREGSLDEQPPSTEELKKAEEEEERREQEQRERDADPANLPNPRQFFSRHPWNDTVAPVTRGATAVHRTQPNTANAAIMKFQRHADNIETASRVATFGSNMTKGRRNSAGDAEKLGGPLKRLSFGKDKDKSKGSPQRKPSIWGGFRTGIKRSLSSAEKDKTNTAESHRRFNSFNSISSTSSSISHFASGRLGTGFSGTSSLKIETNVSSAFAQMASPLMAAGSAAGGSQAAPGGQVSPKQQQASGVPALIERMRSRSKSDLQRKHIFGVVTSLVGPALPMSPPEHETESAPPPMTKKFTFGEESRKTGLADAQKLLSLPEPPQHDDDEDEANEAASPAAAKQAPKVDITPTLDGFARHIRTLTPGLSNKLVDRVAHEQCKRFKKLVEHRHKHLKLVKQNGCCSNGAKCKKVIGAIGVGSDGVVGVSGHKRNNNSLDGDMGFDSSDENDPTSPVDGNVAAAQFPTGVPTPPVFRLPAEFECPICFKVKKFNKPSDWTKHVHEDVQPFTCTFPDCTEPKSFKRKADWVRHENERHRHLEWWTCNQPDCSHTCYRKDNFVQHLVREHKMPEPKVKTQRKGNEGPSQAEINKVWDIVDECHKETDHPPSSEKCRFCGTPCLSWKKLTVHLARHMEAISLPVLELIHDDAVVPQPSKTARRGAAPQPRVTAPQQQTLPQSRTQPQAVPQAQKPQPPMHAMDLDSKVRTSHTGHVHTPLDAEYEIDDTMSGSPFQQQPGHIPQYSLSPPQPQQHHLRSDSMTPDTPNFVQQPFVNGQMVTTSTNLPTTTPMSYAVTNGPGFYEGEEYHHKQSHGHTQTVPYLPQQSGVSSGFSMSNFSSFPGQSTNGFMGYSPQVHQTYSVVPTQPMPANSMSSSDVNNRVPAANNAYVFPPNGPDYDYPLANHIR